MNSKPNKYRFTWGGGAFGDSLNLIIDDEVINLDTNNTGDRSVAENKGRAILSELGIELDDINWEWDGTL